MPGAQRPSSIRGSVSLPAVERGEADPTEQLRHGDIRVLGLMPRASNYTFLCEVENGDRPVLAVYKPRAGETPLWDFPRGTLCRREVAAYLLSRALGWPAVPPTILREGPHGPGSVQLFIEADPAEHYFTMREGRPQSFVPVAAFDVLANNADRKSGHCLLEGEGTIWVVDHGVCFAEEPKLRTVIWDFAGEPIPGTLIADVGRVLGELRSGELRTALDQLLSPGEVSALRDRAERLLHEPRFPLPESRRAFPWPPV